MDNTNYFNTPTAGISANSGQNQPQSEAGQNQPAYFAGMATNLNPLGQAQIPVLPPISELMPPLRQFSTMDVSAHSAPQYLPQLDLSQLDLSQLDLPQPDSPPLDPFLAIATYQPIPFDEGSQLPPDFFGGLEFTTDIGELIGEDLMDSIPVPPEQNSPEPTRKVSFSTAQNTIDTSADEHFVTSISGSGTSTSQNPIIAPINEHLERSLSGASESSQQIRSFTRKRTANEITTQIKKKSRASSAKSILPSAEPASVPASVPFTVHSDVSSAADQSAPEQAPDISKWVIVDKSEEKPFRCGYPKCTKRFKRRHRLKEHIVLHSENRYKCTHPECNESFSYRMVLKRHILTKHTIERPYRCDKCIKRFSHLDTMMAHRRYTHPVRDEQKQSQNSVSTDKWIIYSGDKTRPFKCGYESCGKTYITKQSLQRHFLTHIGNSQFRCYTGDCTGAIRYCDSQALARHIYKKHTAERPYACDICPLRFRRRVYLTHHKEQAHPTENEQAWYKKQKPPPRSKRK